MEHGIFVISLDYELQYGIEDHDYNYVSKYKEHILGVREVIPRMLDLFKIYDIHATWAVVGMILADGKENLLQYVPEEKPSYNDMNHSVYVHFDRIGENESSDPLHFGKEMVKLIADTEGQEIGSHTFSHYYSMEKGQTAEQFASDAAASKKIISDNTNKEPVSIVFPRNQIKEEYKRILAEQGWTAYRGCNDGFAYRNPASDTLFTRGVRLLDAYLGICGPKVYNIDDFYETDSLKNIRASAFLRPYSCRFAFLEPLKIHQIKKGLKCAAKTGRIYHLWWHPHNFGVNQTENLENLESILKYYSFLRDKYGMNTMNMQEIVETYN